MIKLLKLIEEDDAVARAYGEKLAEILNIPKIRGTHRADMNPFYDTGYGKKSAIGIARVVVTILRQKPPSV